MVVNRASPFSTWNPHKKGTDRSNWATAYFFLILSGIHFSSFPFEKDSGILIGYIDQI